MEEIIVLGLASIIALYFVYRIKNLFKGHNPELEEENRIN